MDRGLVLFLDHEQGRYGRARTTAMRQCGQQAASPAFCIRDESRYHSSPPATSSPARHGQQARPAETTNPVENPQEAADAGAAGSWEELAALSTDRLKKIDIPENLRDALREAQRMSSHGAKRRQLQYVKDHARRRC